MSRILINIIFIFSLQNLYSQDTLVIPSAKKVVITDSVNNWEFTYHYLNDPRIKDGASRYISTSKTHKLEDLGAHKNGERTGNWQKYLNDTLWFDLYYKNGYLQGRQKEFCNGKVRVKSKFKKGLRTGTWRYYSGDQLQGKGNYSRKYIDFTSTDEMQTYTFSTGESIVISYFDKAKNNAFYRKYTLIANFNRIWLKKGRWRYYSSDGDLVQVDIHDKNGVLKRSRIIQENDVRWLVW